METLLKQSLLVAANIDERIKERDDGSINHASPFPSYHRRPVRVLRFQAAGFSVHSDYDHLPLCPFLSFLFSPTKTHHTIPYHMLWLLIYLTIEFLNYFLQVHVNY